MQSSSSMVDSTSTYLHLHLHFCLKELKLSRRNPFLIGMGMMTPSTCLQRPFPSPIPPTIVSYSILVTFLSLLKIYDPFSVDVAALNHPLLPRVSKFCCWCIYKFKSMNSLPFLCESVQWMIPSKGPGVYDDGA